MGATMRGEAAVEGTGELLVFDANAIDRIEAAADRSIFDLLEEMQTAIEAKRLPRLGTMGLLVWGSFLASRPNITRDEAFAIVTAKDEAVLTAMARALQATFPEKVAGADAAANPPNRQQRRAAAAKAGS